MENPQILLAKMIQTTKKPTATLRKILQQPQISTQVKSKNKEAAFTYIYYIFEFFRRRQTIHFCLFFAIFTLSSDI